MNNAEDNKVVVSTTANPVACPQWDKRLVMDVVLGASEEVILEEYELTVFAYRRILADPRFQTSVDKMHEELSKDGMSFKLKAQLQAEAMLDENWKLVHSPLTDPAVKVRAIANTARWAGYDAPPQQGGLGTGGFSININLGNAGQGVTIDHEPD